MLGQELDHRGIGLAAIGCGGYPDPQLGVAVGIDDDPIDGGPAGFGRHPQAHLNAVGVSMKRPVVGWQGAALDQ